MNDILNIVQLNKIKIIEFCLYFEKETFFLLNNV